jgi:hypothetical protein
MPKNAFHREYFVIWYSLGWIWLVETKVELGLLVSFKLDLVLGWGFSLARGIVTDKL